MLARLFLRVAFPVLCMVTCAAQATPGPRIVSLTAADGAVLKATYFAAGKPGPGALLLHQCNQARKGWDGLAAHLASHGINVLTLDYRGFGDSDGARYEKLTDEARKLVIEKWPGDFDMALQYLEAQPGVSHEVIGAGGASCGVHNSVQLARRHPEVKALMLLSGGTDRDGRLFLQSSKSLPVFTAAAEDDSFGRLTDTMQWLYSVSANPASRFEVYANGGHGAEMFAPHPELLDFIADWFAATLMNKPGMLPKTNGSPVDRALLSNLNLIDQPGGASEGAKKLWEARGRDPGAVLFPEGLVNLLGYERLRAGDTKGAVEIMKLNVSAYPGSANVYDSLSDAYVADGQMDLAIQSAKKALELLTTDRMDSEGEHSRIRENAEKKLKQLETSR
jgi:dienelactone hydrolase